MANFPVMMNTNSFTVVHSHAVSCFERLFGLKTKFIRRIAKDAEKMVGCLYHSRNYLIPSVMIYLFTRPRTDQNWSIVAIFGLKLFNHHFPTLTESKRTQPCGRLTMFLPTTTDATS